MNNLAIINCIVLNNNTIIGCILVYLYSKLSEMITLIFKLQTVLFY